MFEEGIEGKPVGRRRSPSTGGEESPRAGHRASLKVAGSARTPRRPRGRKPRPPSMNDFGGKGRRVRKKGPTNLCAARGAVRASPEYRVHYEYESNYNILYSYGILVEQVSTLLFVRHHTMS